jgi:hypothetical protein
LLAAAAVARHIEANPTGTAPPAGYERYLSPPIALKVRAAAYPNPVTGRDLTCAQDRAVERARADYAALMPAWQPLLALPVRFLELWPPTGAISASCWAWPQHVLLAADAFATPTQLREQVVHELCHQWLYLIEECWHLQQPGAEQLVLPSGTADRSPAEARTNGSPGHYAW